MAAHSLVNQVPEPAHPDLGLTPGRLPRRRQCPDRCQRTPRSWRR
jgi:hypothetical protein